MELLNSMISGSAGVGGNASSKSASNSDGQDDTASGDETGSNDSTHGASSNPSPSPPSSTVIAMRGLVTANGQTQTSRKIPGTTFTV